MKKYYAVLSSALLFALFLGGCASSEVLVKKPVETKFNQFSNFVLAVESNVTEEVADEITALEVNVMNRVRGLNLFQTTKLGIDENLPEGTLIVKATITDINKVSGTARFFLGAFAGQASMTINMQFIDGATNNVIGEIDVTGKSGGTGYAGGTNEAIDKAAEAVADVVTQNYE